MALWAQPRGHRRSDQQWPWRGDADMGRPPVAGRDQGAGRLCAQSGRRGVAGAMDRHPPRDHAFPTPAMAAEGVVRSDAVASNSAANRKLFESRVPIYPKEVDGIYRNLKWAMMAITLSIYYLTPWLRWNRGPGAPGQAVLVDLAHERLYFFFIEIWPQEVYYITGLLILAAVSLFLINALFGRLWCGYACPQTVWTDLFIWVETKIEGDRNARMRLAAAPWPGGKMVRRI